MNLEITEKDASYLIAATEALASAQLDEAHRHDMASDEHRYALTVASYARGLAERLKDELILVRRATPPDGSGPLLHGILD